MLLFLAIFFVIGAQGQEISYDELKGYRCYTPRGQYNTKDLRCGAIIKEERSCEDLSETATTFARTENMSMRKHYCDITFIGRCTSEAFNRGAHDLCFVLKPRRANYTQAVKDCKRSGGSLFVPDSDYELSKIIELIDGRLKRFWLGGGSIFSRSCPDPSQNEDFGVMYSITEKDDRYLGYSTTRRNAYRASYICAMPKRRGNKNCLKLDRRVDEFIQAPLLPTTPVPSQPRCSFTEPIRSGAARVIETCFNDGSLKIGDKLVVEGQTPQCCPDIGEDDAVWSINLYSREKAPWFHYGIQNGWQRMVWTVAEHGWGAGWSEGKNYDSPFTPSSNFTMEITNKEEGFEVLFNGRSYSEPHAVAGDHGNQYFYLAFVSYSEIKIYSAAVIRNGTPSEIALGVAA